MLRTLDVTGRGDGHICARTDGVDSIAIRADNICDIDTEVTRCGIIEGSKNSKARDNPIRPALNGSRCGDG